MFTDYFKMKIQPFLERTPVDRLLKDERISQGLARLKYLAEGGDIALITGQTGVGKSSLIKLFINSLSRHRYNPVYVHLTHVEAPGLLKLIVKSLGEMPKRGKESLFLQIQEKAQEKELMTILIIDEAHLVKSEALTDLRLLVSSALDDIAPLKLILCGQETLRDQLKQMTHADLVHRISVRYRILPLTKDQTVTYIDFQIKNSGVSKKIFDEEAKELIHDYANGIPRQINNIATTCLFNAFTKNMQKVNEQLVNETMTEIQIS